MDECSRLFGERLTQSQLDSKFVNEHKLVSNPHVLRGGSEHCLDVIQLLQNAEDFKRRWNFDIEKECPFQGAFVYERVHGDQDKVPEGKPSRS